MLRWIAKKSYFKCTGNLFFSRSTIVSFFLLQFTNIICVELSIIIQTHLTYSTLFISMSKYNKEEVLEKAEKDLAVVTDQHVSRLVKELQGTDFWKLRRAYSPGVYFITFLVEDRLTVSQYPLILVLNLADTRVYWSSNIL